MKYAYLIIANKNHSQLQKLLTMLDDSRNDIYLMIDKKSRNFPRNFCVKYSTLNYVTPINIYWGDYSQIQAELDLFRAAAPEHYTYYHLLSGVDLPLVNQDRIHEFFDTHLNHEFLTYGNPKNFPLLSARIKHYLFRNHFRDTNNLLLKIYRKIEFKFLKLLHGPIPMNKIDYASQWVSIDDDLVQALILNKNKIRDIYRYGTGVDELFIPIFLNYHPKLKKRVYDLKHVHDEPDEFQGNMRYIDWWTNHGGSSPYIWRLKDFDRLIYARQMGELFSREFDSTIDRNIIDKIFNDVMNS